MAINKNHEFEELGGIKCGIVERNVLPERADFLKGLLEFNKYTVVIVASSPPKALPVAVSEIISEANTVPQTYTIGVTDYTFNPVNAIYGRMLKTPDGHVVTPAFWQQKEMISHDEVPYYEKNID